jgi:hypothetical protein
LAGGFCGKIDEVPRRLIAGAAAGRFDVRLAVTPKFSGQARRLDFQSPPFLESERYSRRLIAVIAVLSLSNAFRFDRQGVAGLRARPNLRLLNVIFLRSQVVPSVSFAARGVFGGRYR